MFLINTKEYTESIFSFASSISQGKDVVWFVNHQAGIIKFKIKSSLIGKNGMPLFYNKTKMKVTSFDELNDNKMLDQDKEYQLDIFFKTYSKYGYFFFKKTLALRYMIDKLNSTVKKNKHHKSLEYIKNNPEFLI